MHGRVKVKSTLEQQEAKRKEREKKLVLYSSATKAALRKRDAGELDEEALELTAQILTLNPDFASLWNLRRNVFLHQGACRPQDEMRPLYTTELSFLESCLRTSPKSYGTWYHRCWVMGHISEPDWAHELALCNRFLEIDERNFHCWDYRRFVAQSSLVSLTDELEFTNNLITKNFSNYSSWHYRSKLLPQIHPDPLRLGRVTEEALLTELELVQNAFFTDPSDQSSWFYHRWLLGRADYPLSIRSILVSVEGPSVCVSFSQPIKVEDDLILFLDGRPLMASWKTPEGKKKPSLLWVCALPKESVKSHVQHKFQVVFNDGEAEKECILYPGKQQTWCCDQVTKEQIFRLGLSEGKSNILQHELKSCKELQELEPENKWCLLTIILLMRALDPLSYEKESLSYFDILKVVDPIRSGYYDDLRSKFHMENAILKMEYAEAHVIDLAKKGLTRLYHLDHLMLVTHMDLSSNLLKSLPPDVSMMRCIEVLECDNNEISHLQGVWNLSKLEELSLQYNTEIQNVSDLQPLSNCPRLSVLRLQGNPLCEVADAQADLEALLPNVETIQL